MPRFTIIMPVYNVENEISQCLQSIQNQTFKDFEVICVDDCGSDNSIKIIEEIASNDNRFKIIKHSHNQGVSAARNTALAAAQGEYLVFVDPDDWIELNQLEVLDKSITISKKDFILFGFYTHYDDGSKAKYLLNQSGNFKANGDIIWDIVGCVWNKCFKTSRIKELGITFPVGLVIEDSEFCFKAITQIKHGYYIRETLYNYRKQRKGSITTEDILNDRLEDHYKIFERIYDYTIEKNLFREYKKALLKWFTRNMYSLRGTPQKREFIIKTADRLLKKMDFPNAFKDLEYSNFVIWKN